MRVVFCSMLIAIIMIGCDSSRVYENNVDFKDRSWKIAEPAKFDFQISDTSKKYNLMMDLRNSLEYPYARLFINWELKKDSLTLSKELISVYLFDQKTGKPFGNSGIGDIYDHQFSILKHFTFKKTGNYRMNFQQFMRLDTIPGILAVGLRVEVVEK
ncbi:MAG: gliding motility lipoprotein GldH [Bacteroidetes bacterium]|nr:gliding motility lipoprotein GldH [Bacteroidota bacterium]MBI3481533.1 gliding motility lipoprotein GldH [Bacteroidota bacterium]